MSVALTLNVHDGVILAADSASTLLVTQTDDAKGGPSVASVYNVYNNANKIANLCKGRPIGCVAFGSGSIGSASISTLLKDFRARIASGADILDKDNFTMEQAANQLANFLAAECSKLNPGTPQPDLGLFLAGYSTGAALGERWAIAIRGGKADTPNRLHKPEEVGINWGGEGGEAISRLVLGHSAALPQIIQNIIRPKEQAEKLMQTLLPQLQVPILFAPMPIQDAIDLAEFLVSTAIAFSRFTPGPQVVGGPIEIAAITKHEGFKWIRRKHYYGIELNRGGEDES